MAVSTPAAASPGPAINADRWTSYSITVLAICILGWAFDIYEATIMQLVTPILIKEWGITPATMGTVTTVSRWLGLVGTFVFPVLADFYGRKPCLIGTILGYALFTGLTGFAVGPISLLVFSSITRVALAGENPVGMIMVTETAPTKWRATALGGLVGGYPFGYMVCALCALVFVPLWGWRSLYFLGILPALLVLWVRTGIKESPRYEHVTLRDAEGGAEEEARHPRALPRLSARDDDRDARLFLLSLDLDRLVGVDAVLSRHREAFGLPAMSSYLSVWMFVAIFAYWLCGWLCDVVGRRYVIPAFTLPAAVLLVVMGYVSSPSALFWVGLVTNFLITGSFGTGLGYTNEVFPTQIRGAGVGASFTVGLGLASFAPLVIGWIATGHSVAAGLPLLALSFLLIAPLFIWFAPDTTRRDLADFVGERVG